jgi:outer membrane lipoprotein SlyB
MTRYRLTDTYDPSGDLFTAEEAREMMAASFGEQVSLRETPDGRLVRDFETSGLGIVIGYAA